jgi:hypothetical protein
MKPDMQYWNERAGRPAALSLVIVTEAAFFLEPFDRNIGSNVRYDALLHMAKKAEALKNA